MDKDQDFTTTIWVDQSEETVYNTIMNVRAWWSGLYGESFEGSSAKLGDEFRFMAGGGMHDTNQKLVALVPNSRAAWVVTDAKLSFVSKTDEWKDTRISFDISEEAGKTKVVFTHVGLVPSLQCYDSCSSAWTQYIQERLTEAIKKSN